MSANLQLNSFSMPSHGHNIPDGHIGTCQVCGSDDLRLVIDLGHQPLCDSLLTAAQLNLPEKTFPLRLYRCTRCTLTQLDYAVPSSEVYHPEYPYRSGITREVVTHMVGLASECTSRLRLGKSGYVLDIGCNDGTLLKAFSKLGVPTLGVEPTNIANIAREEGIEVIQSFFNESLAADILREKGPATVVTATNVFAHMSTLGDVMRGIKIVLADNGHFVCETHYLPEIQRKNQYDSIYHEHLRSYTLRSLIVLFHLYSMTVVRAEVMDRYSGTLRVFVNNELGAAQDATVGALLEKESQAGLDTEVPYELFRQATIKSRLDLLELAYSAQRKGQSFVGNSCPGRSSTLINYVGITKSDLPYICEQPTSLKLGMFLPGKHIPIVQNTRLEREQPDYIVLLAWHYADTICKELRDRGIRSKLVLPLPKVTVIDPQKTP